MDRGNIHIAVVFNDPSSDIDLGKRAFLEEMQLNVSNSYSNKTAGLVDLSEVGVIEEREKVEIVLQEKGYQTSFFNIDGDIKRLIKFLEEQKPTLIFNLCESLLGQAINEMHVAGIYELMNIPYTGTGTLALGTCLNKVRTKEILNYHAISTARYVLVNKTDTLSRENFTLHFPVIVKPSREDASAGIENSSVVNDFAELSERIGKVIKSYNQPALVEEYIEGRELNVAIIGNNPPIVLPISEIDFSGLPDDYPKIVTFNAKWLEGSPEYVGTVGKCPAHLSSEVEETIKKIALRVYRIMEVRDYGRVDIRLDNQNRPFVLEINPNPDISRDAGYARSARAAEITFEDMIVKIVDCTLERCRLL